MKYEENIKKLIEDIKERANHPIVRHNNINYITKRRWNIEPERRIFNIKNMSFDKKGLYTEEKKEDIKLFNNKRIEELYEEYKKMKNDLKVEQNQKEIEDLNKIKEENKEKIKEEENHSENKSENNSLNDTQN